MTLDRVVEENEQTTGGRIGGTNSYLGRVGVHARTKEQMTADARKSVRARGQVPYVPRIELNTLTHLSELHFAHLLSLHPEYRRWQNGRGKGGYINTEKIAQELNDRFHDGETIRTGSSLSVALLRYRKARENEKG